MNVTTQGDGAMKNLLIVNSSPRRNSVSRQLTRHLAEQWMKANPGGKVVERDLAADAPPFLTHEWIEASATPEQQRTPAQHKALELSDTYIAELMAADVIVMGIPMHNFSVPAPLKAWFDLVTRAGKTFRYGNQGPEGMLGAGKKVLAIVSRGGAYAEGSAADFQVPYVRHMLGFVGLKDVTFIAAERQSMGAEAAAVAAEEARRQIASTVHGADNVAQLAA